MTQLSRPYQIALVGIGLLVVVWFVALRGHSSGTSATSVSASQPQTSTPAAKPAAPSSSHHSSAPGIAGLTRAIEKAHGAVVQSERDAKQLQEKSAQASSSAPTTPAATSPRPSVTSKSRVAAPHRPPRPAGASATPAKASASPRMQPAVEAELKAGKIVTILFWNPHAPVDRVVHAELQAVGRALAGKLAVHNAQPSEVGAFGSFTRAVQVYQTPTILIVGRHGQTSSLSGLTDAFSLKQAIAEAGS